jgi:cell division protein FtsQ
MTGRSPSRPGATRPGAGSPRGKVDGSPPRTGGARTGGARTPARAPSRTAPRAPAPRTATASGGLALARTVPFGGNPGSTVSSSSAARFAARARHRRHRRLVVVAVSATAGVLLGRLFFGSTLLAVHRVEVRGLHRVSAEAVQAAAVPEVGQPMALISPQAVARRVAIVPLVRSVRVVRSWPQTLVVEVVERQPIAAVPAAGGQLSLVDDDGVDVQTVAQAPAGLPVLDVDVARAGVGALNAARQVAGDIPVRLRPGLRRIGATSPDDVTFTLADGTTVIWGSADDPTAKAAALLAVRARSGSHSSVIDISAPDSPAVTAKR